MYTTKNKVIINILQTEQTCGIVNLSMLQRAFKASLPYEHRMQGNAHPTVADFDTEVKLMKFSLNEKIQ